MNTGPGVTGRRETRRTIFSTYDTCQIDQEFEVSARCLMYPDFDRRAPERARFRRERGGAGFRAARGNVSLEKYEGREENHEEKNNDKRNI